MDALNYHVSTVKAVSLSWSVIQWTAHIVMTHVGGGYDLNTGARRH